MKQWLLIAGVILSSSTDLPSQMYWAIWGPLDISTQTANSILPIGVSSGPVSNVILHSQTTPDCYRLIVLPNGTLGTEWVTCQ